MKSLQLDLFSNSEFDYLNQSVEKYKTSMDNVRRGVFARVDALKKDHGQRLSQIETDMQELRSILDKLFGTTESNIIDLQSMM